jgi:predicted negative regulator of RcsB-dependent stress response
VDEYLSEKEQIEGLKQRVREYGPYALAGVIVAVGGLYGWKYYQSTRAHQGLEAAAKVEAIAAQLGGGDAVGAGKAADALRDGYGRTPYADEADLMVARGLTDAGDLLGAMARVENVIRNTGDEEMKAVAMLRKARLQRAMGKPDDGLKTINAALEGGQVGELGAFAARFLEVKGDLLGDKGDANGAAAAWQEALAKDKDGVLARELVELKLNQAGGTAPAAANTAATAATGGAQ